MKPHKDFDFEALNLKRKRYKEQTKPSTDSLRYLDSILTVLSLSLGDYVAEKDLLVQVSHKKDDNKRHASILRISTEYLKEKNLIYKLKNPDRTYNYIITFEGMVTIESGGLLKRAKNEKTKDLLQKGFWLLAFITFAVNTYFQIANFLLPIKIPPLPSKVYYKDNNVKSKKF